jgi:hypothetical protein
LPLPAPLRDGPGRVRSQLARGPRRAAQRDTEGPRHREPHHDDSGTQPQSTR